MAHISDVMWWTGILSKLSLSSGSGSSWLIQLNTSAMTLIDGAHLRCKVL